jgi:hypothetical protein
MSLSLEISKFFDAQREVLTLRKELCEVRKKQYANWAMKARRAGADDVAALIERSYEGFFQNELVAIDYLTNLLNELQTEASALVTRWEAENAERS